MNGKNRLGIFLFCDAQGIVSDYVTYMLDDMMKCVKHMVIVCNGILSDQGRKAFSKYTEDIIVRPNEGFDAAGWRQAMVDYLGFDKVAEYEELILFNDSFFGPFHSFDGIFAEMDEKNVDFWGLSSHGSTPDIYGYTELGYRPRYIQTYFMVFGAKVIRNKEFQDYWINMPVYTDFKQLSERHGASFTYFLEKLGFTWDVYSNTWDLESEDLKKNMSHHSFNAYEMVARRKFPILKRKIFITPKTTVLRYNSSDDLRKALDYVKKHTDYDVQMIYSYLLRCYNITDLKNNLNMNYVLPVETGAVSGGHNGKKAAVVAHIYYNELISYCWEYLSQIPESIDLVITTDCEEKKEAILAAATRPVEVVLVERRGRDLAALLVGAKEYLMKYDYLCFVHDKMSRQKEHITVGGSFCDLLWDNLLISETYIEQVLHLFDTHEELGLLMPPAVMHGTYFISSVNFWTICYEKTVELAESLKIQANFDHDKQPIAVGTAFWCKTDALAPLFEYPWTYDDFPKEPMDNDGTISHALERILPFVAQSQGYFSGWVMNNEYAATDIETSRYMLGDILKKLKGMPGIVMANFQHLSLSLEQIKNLRGIQMVTVGVKGAVRSYIARHTPAKLKNMYHIQKGRMEMHDNGHSGNRT